MALGAVPVVSAERDSEETLAADGEIDCYFSFHDKFNMIYNDVRDWANSMVLLTHDKWEKDVYLRVGDVGRKSNSTVKDIWDSGPEAGDLVMVAGDWTMDDRNKWVWGAGKGRINTDRCPDKDSAYKYWFHEIGHAHGLPHRDEWGGQLMDSGDPTAMHLNESECTEWNDSYGDGYSTSASTTSSSVSSSTDEGHTHSGKGHGEAVVCGPSEETICKWEKQGRDETESVVPPEVKRIEKLDN